MSTLADQTATQQFAVHEREGRTTVLLNGEEIQNHVAGYQINHHAGDGVATVLLEVARGDTIHPALDILARVSVAETEPGPAAAAFLSAIDPEQLETAALNRDDLDTGPGGLTGAMLRQMIDWANGRA